MRTVLLTLSLIILALPAAAQSGETYKRKPGLWELTIGAQGQKQTIKQCIDEATDAKMQQMGQSMSEHCSKQTNRREGDHYIAESECDMMGSKITSKAVFKGDFSSSYTGEVSATYNPPLMGQEKSTSQITGRLLGPCEAGQQPGDMIMPNGMKVNIETMRKMGGAR